MLDKSATYHKSPRGAEAIATRHGELTPRQRSMLILINGRRSYDELAQLGQMLGDPERLMEQLEQSGFIEPGEPRPGPPSAPAPLLPVWGHSGWGQMSGPAPLGGGDSSYPGFTADPIDHEVPLDQAQRFAVARLKDMLGPAADDLCVKLQAATTAPEFTAAVRNTEAILRAMVGPELATQFTREVESQRVL
ncbi:MAG: hypothetical protein JWQ76_1699 [Ramlibacter sp.]|nr:hypothetical protein [Ramlibacter sp.]